MTYATFSDFVQPYRSPVGRRAAMQRLEWLSTLLDTALVIPGTGIRFGADSIIGLAPAAGDVVTTVAAAYIVYEAHRLGVPRDKLLRMVTNLAIDGAVGAVPVLGDIFDVAFRANRRNMRIIREHLDANGMPHRR